MTTRRTAQTLWAAACGAIAIASPREASGAPSARLIYGRSVEAEACPDEASLRKAVASRVGYDPFFPYAARTVVLTIRGSEGGLAARIELLEENRATASRELSTRGASCDELFQSAALAIAIAIDPRALVAPTSPVPPEDAEPAEAAPPPAPENRRPAPPEDPKWVAKVPAPLEPRWPHVRLIAGPRAAIGVQPGLAPGLSLGASAIWRRASIGAELGANLPTSVTSPSSAEVRGWLFSGALLPCLRFAPLVVCGVFRAGRFEGSGQGVLDATTQATPFFAIGGRPGVEIALAPAFHLHFDAEVLGNLSRTTLRVGNEAVWRASPLALALSSGISLQFE